MVFNSMAVILNSIPRTGHSYYPQRNSDIHVPKVRALSCLCSIMPPCYVETTMVTDQFMVHA